jgi:hypothetical protein
MLAHSRWVSFRSHSGPSLYQGTTHFPLDGGAIRSAITPRLVVKIAKDEGQF